MESDWHTLYLEFIRKTLLEGGSLDAFNVEIASHRNQFSVFFCIYAQVEFPENENVSHKSEPIMNYSSYRETVWLLYIGYYFIQESHLSIYQISNWEE